MCVKIKLYTLSSWYKIMFLKHTLKICMQAQNDFVFVLIIMYACMLMLSYFESLYNRI